ncbi:oligosaccharide flippase family protein [Pseudotamlana carrageenivorans]|uniref:oligosaccharide flippase family protein n=1 Tax=Pseudotamlana carrageenivorans TaxID=2069432 RepID=UPI0013151014|nr:oligosaccharide flippase family protein [Tamlana carrageenivorans]
MSTLQKNITTGFIWTGIQTVGTKLIALTTQLFLAWLLVPEDFGKVSIATSITSVIFLIQALGLSDVMVSRGHMYFKVFNLAKSIAALTSLACFLISILTGLITGIYLFQDIEITYLILIFSFCVPFNAMSVIADAKLRIDLKFKQLSFIRLLEFFISNFLLVSFVLLNLGIYSFVLAPVVASISRYFLIHKIANVQHLFHFSLHHYTYLLSNSLWGFLHNICQTIIRQSDYLIIGLFVSTQAVGLYFMGYSLSVQVIGLLVNSLTPVFFPILRKINTENKEKIKIILIKIITVFSLFGMCFSFLQATLAEPLMTIFLEPKWKESILIVQILSIGIGFNVASTVWAISLKLKNAFYKQAILSLQGVTIFIISITLATKYYGTIGTAVSVSLYNIFFNLYLLAISLKYYNIEIRTILNISFKYFFIALIIFGTTYLITFDAQFNNWTKILINSIIPATIYFISTYLFDNNSKNIYQEIYTKFVKK